MFKNRRWQKIISIFLSLTLVTGLSSSFKIQAAESNEEPVLVPTPKQSVEMTNERTRYSKRFANPDGTITERIYSVPVHYTDPNTDQMVPVDSNLRVKENGHFENKGNDFSVELKKDITDGFVDVKDGNVSLSFRPLFATTSEGTIDGNSATYEEVAKNTDLVYDVVPNGLKETIVLKSSDAPKSFSFELKAPNITFKENEDRTVAFYRQGQSEPVMLLAAPFMVDAKNEVSFDVTYELEIDRDGKILLEVVPDTAWLKGPGRAYPVKIDPTIDTSIGDAYVQDTFVESLASSSNFTHYTHNMIGLGEKHGTTRPMLWFYLDGLPSGAVISKSELNILNDLSEVEQYPKVEVWRINSPWSHNTVTWDAAQQLSIGNNGRAESKKYSVDNFRDPKWWLIDITELTRDWYNGTQPNYGLQLRYENEQHVLRQLYSTVDPRFAPWVQITYKIDGLGSQSFWTYDGPVNMGNRNLVHSEEDLHFLGLGTPLTLQRTYNSRSDKDGLFGYGWSSALDIELNVPAKGPGQLIEADGSVHFFHQNLDGTYKTLPGLHWLLGGTAGSRTITTPEQTKYTFYGTKLKEVRDVAGNTLTYTYSSNKPISIKDRAGNTISLTFGSNGKVATATDPASRKWTYGYDAEGNLIKVTAPDGTATQYRYDNTHNLVAAVSPQGRETYYVYSSHTNPDYDDRLQAINSTNAVTNANFEVDTGTLKQPDHFALSDGVDKMLVDSTAGSPFGQAVKIPASTGNGSSYSAYLSEKIWVDSTKPYTLSGSLKATQTSGVQTTILSLMSYNKNGNFLAEVNADTRIVRSNSFGWQRVTKTYPTLPAGTAYVRIKLGAANGSGSGTSWFDAVQFERGSVATEFLTGTQYTSYAPTGQAASYDGEGRKTLYNYDVNTQNLIKKQLDPSGLNLTTSFGWSENELSSRVEPQQYTGQTTDKKWEYKYFKGSPIYQKDPLGQEEWNTYDSSLNLVAHQGPRGAEEKSYFTYDSGKHQKTSRDPYYTSTAQDHDVYGNLTSKTNELGWADNLVDNSSMESSENADGTPVHFAYFSGQKDTWRLLPDSVFGKKSLSLTASNSDVGYAVLVSDFISVDRTEEYVLAGYVKSEQTSGMQKTVLSILPFDSNGSPLPETGRINQTGAADWQRIATLIQPSDFPVNTAKVRVKLAVANDSGQGESRFDAIQLQKNPVDTVYNLLDNSSFERGASSTLVPEFWEKTAFSGTYNWVTTAPGVDQNVYAGGRAMSVATTGDTTGSTGYHYTEYIPYDSSQSYQFSAFVKTTSGANGMVKIAMYDSEKKYLGFVSESLIGRSDWKRLVVELSPGGAMAGTAFLKPLLRTGTPTGTVYFDNVRLQTDSKTSKYSYKSQSSWLTKEEDPHGNLTTYEYDVYGNQTKVTSPKLNTTVKEFDAMDRLVNEFPPGNELKIHYAYNADDQLTSITQSDIAGTQISETKYSYNGLGLLTSVDDPLAENPPKLYSYTPAGKLKQIQSPDGRTVSYAYDKVGRLVDTSYNGKVRYYYVYDRNGNVTSVEDLGIARKWLASYDVLNRLTSIDDGQGKITYVYDSHGNVTQQQLQVGTISKIQKAAYNLVDQPVKLTDANGKSTRFLYNEFEMLSATQKGNGTTQYIDYNNLGQITSLRNLGNDGKHLSTFAYKYDADGNLVSVKDFEEKETVFEYTVNGELSKETLPSGELITYDYDGQGNRKQRIHTLTDGTAKTTAYEYNQSNQLIKVDDDIWTYDKNGQLVSNTAYSFKWDEAGRLLEVRSAIDGTQVVSYEYDHLGRRVVEYFREHSKTYLYEGNSSQVAAELSDGVLSAYYTWSTTGQLLSITDCYIGETYYTVSNSHGDIINLTDESGAIVATYTYDVWGKVTASGEKAPMNPYRYAGYRYDELTGLYFLNARYYNPEVGAFLSSDPISKIPSYQYVRNNPSVLVDPSGMMERHMDGVFYGGAGNYAGIRNYAAQAAAPVNKSVAVSAPKPTNKRWQVGDDVYQLTSKGKEPSWSTVRARFWKNEGAKPDAALKYGTENLKRLIRGRAPQRYNPDKPGMESMELSHEPIPFRDGGKDFVPRWPQDHARVDVFRRPGY